MFLTEYDQDKVLARERQEGINEDRRRVATAMLKKNLPLALIAEISKLSEDVIKNIAHSLGVSVV